MRYCTGSAADSGSARRNLCSSSGLLEISYTDGGFKQVSEDNRSVVPSIAASVLLWRPWAAHLFCVPFATTTGHLSVSTIGQQPCAPVAALLSDIGCNDWF